jgi:hypothetical protein
VFSPGLRAAEVERPGYDGGTMRRGLDGFSDDVRAWRAATPGRAPVYHRLLEEAVALFQGPVGSTEEAARARVEAAWRERKQSSPYARPLLLMAALRAEALRAGPRHPLFEAIGAPQPQVAVATRERLALALGDASPRLFADLATRTVQTNETSRAVAWRWPAALAGCDGGARALALYDLGCSAGLNLAGDRLPPLWTDPSGAPLPVASRARIVLRRGFDAGPLDVNRDSDRLWLTACVWPGEEARLQRLIAAIEAFRALGTDAAAPRLETADLADVPERLQGLTSAAGGPLLHLAYQTVVRDYLNEAVRQRYVDGMRRWLAGADAVAPRVWIELEAPPGGGSMAIEAHLANGSGARLDLTLARCGYHPDRVTPDAGAAAAFAAALAPR